MMESSGNRRSAALQALGGCLCPLCPGVDRHQPEKRKVENSEESRERHTPRLRRIRLSWLGMRMPPPVVSSRSWSEFAGTPRRREWSRARTGGECAPRYSCLDDLTPVIFVTTGGWQALYSAGRTASTPLFLSRTTTNFADLVLLALRPMACTSSGPS